MDYLGNEMKEKSISEKDLIEILSDPEHWCPSKEAQWTRMAKAIIEKIEKLG